MFLRFVITQIHETSNQPLGLFVAAHRLLESNELSPEEWRRLREALVWFNKNLPSPRYEAASRRIFWFKASAEECIRRMWN